MIGWTSTFSPFDVSHLLRVLGRLPLQRHESIESFALWGTVCYYLTLAMALKRSWSFPESGAQNYGIASIKHQSQRNENAETQKPLATGGKPCNATDSRHLLQNHAPKVQVLPPMPQQAPESSDSGAFSALFRWGTVPGAGRRTNCGPNRSIRCHPPLLFPPGTASKKHQNFSSLIGLLHPLYPPRPSVMPAPIRVTGGPPP